MNGTPLPVTLPVDPLDAIYIERGCIVRVKGESDKSCSDECRREYNRAYHRKLRADNAEHFRQYNRKRMITQRNKQYKERVEPFYNKLKSLILSEEDDAALELLTDISLGRLTSKRVK